MGALSEKQAGDRKLCQPTASKYLLQALASDSYMLLQWWTDKLDVGWQVRRSDRHGVTLHAKAATTQKSCWQTHSLNSL